MTDEELARHIVRLCAFDAPDPTQEFHYQTVVDLIRHHVSEARAEAASDASSDAIREYEERLD